MRASREEIPVAFAEGEFASHQTQWGEMTVAFEKAPTGMDSRPLFEGALPGDACQCPHWGYVIKGRMRVIYSDREEIVNAGEAYYLEPGHNVVCEEEGELVEFSPREQYKETMEAVTSKMQATR